LFASGRRDGKREGGFSVSIRFSGFAAERSGFRFSVFCLCLFRFPPKAGERRFARFPAEAMRFDIPAKEVWGRVGRRFFACEAAVRAEGAENDDPGTSEPKEAILFSGPVLRRFFLFGKG